MQNPQIIHCPPGCLHSVHTTVAKLCSTPGHCPAGHRATFQKVHWQSYVGQGPFWAAWVPRASTYQTSSLQIFSVFFITLSLSTSSPDSGMLAFCGVVIKTTLFLLLFFCCLHSRNKQGRGKRHKTELRKEWPDKRLVKKYEYVSHWYNEKPIKLASTYNGLTGIGGCKKQT